MDACPDCKHDWREHPMLKQYLDEQPECSECRYEVDHGERPTESDLCDRFADGHLVPKHHRLRISSWQDAAMGTLTSRQLAGVANRVAPSMKAAEFRKRGNSFNRFTTDGLAQVLSLQSSSFNPRTAELSGSTEPPSAAFTVNLGIRLPDEGRDDSSSAKVWVAENQCDLRLRLGQLLPPGGDRWWDMFDSRSRDEAVDAIMAIGLPWLEMLSSTQAVVAAVQRATPLDLRPHANARLQRLL